MIKIRDSMLLIFKVTWKRTEYRGEWLPRAWTCACDQEDEKESNLDEDNSKLAVIDPWAIDDRIQQARQTKMIIEKLTFTISNSQEEEDYSNSMDLS